jgi:hypothetical protein
MSPEGLELVSAIPLNEAEQKLLGDALGGEMSPDQATQE